MKLRDMTVSDLHFLLEVRNDITTRSFLENDSIFKYEECKQWFETTEPKWYIIEVDDNPVGYIRTNGDEVGCDIHPKFRRKGYARKAYEIYLSVKSYATLWVFEDNFAKNLYESLGFKPTGDVKHIRNKPYLKMVLEK